MLERLGSDAAVTSLSGLGGDGDGNRFENPDIDLNDPQQWALLGAGGITDAGERVSPQKALGYAPLWRAMNLVSGDIARMPLIRYARQASGGKEPDRRGASFRILRRQANKYVRASHLKRVLTFHAMYRGNGFAYIQRRQNGDPVGLIPLDPCVTALLAVDDELWYLTQAAGQDVRLPAADVFHIRGLGHDGLWGIDVYALMRESLGLPLAARKFSAGFFGSGSNQSGVLMVPDHFSDEKIKNTLAMWKATAQGLSKSHQVALLKENVKFVPTSAKPRESMLTEQLEHEIRMVSAITGVPPHKLGDSSRTSYNSLEMENQSYLDDALEPWCSEWEEEADAKLLSDAERENETHLHEFNRSARLRSDSKTRAEVYNIYRSMGVFNANDVRRRENLPTLGPEGDVYYVPSNWTAVGKIAESKAQAALRRQVAQIVDRKLEIEQAKVAQAAGREKDLSAWCEGFYREHATHLIEALRLPVRAWSELTGQRVRLKSAVAAWLTEHAAAVAAADDAASVAQGWSSRSLLQALMPTRKRCPKS
ncbi:MAG: phage portal protein [Phycisphaeraceae bacterium]|nr:phage portal protein [Phycisphaeraceae bacterium]